MRTMVCDKVAGNRTTCGTSSGEVRLNRRGKVFVAILAGLAMWVGLALVVPSEARSLDGPTEVSSYTVQPGGTMWSFAVGITPKGGDVNDTIDELVKLNGLDSVAIQAGQRLIVPDSL